MAPIADPGVVYADISGSSDDLIQIDGSVSAELKLPSGDIACLKFQDGSVIRIDYSESRPGLWTVKPVYIAVGSYFGLEFQAIDDDSDQYSDIGRLTMRGWDSLAIPHVSSF